MDLLMMDGVIVDLLEINMLMDFKEVMEKY